MLEKTKSEFHKALTNCKIAKANQTAMVNAYNLVDDRILLDSLAAFDKAEVYQLSYLKAVIRNKIQDEAITKARERKNRGTLPKENV